MSFHFSTVLSGHSKDVRCLASIPDPASSSGGSCIISGSRDCTVKLWHQDNSTSPPVWEERLTFAGHKKYVSCVAAQLPNDKFPEGLIYTGSNDNYIRAYHPGSVNPMFEEEAHADTVSCFFVSPVTGTLLSGSWDMTAKVWVDNLKPVMTLKGHEAAVWAVAILPRNGLMVTGGADKRVILWQAGQAKKKLDSAHTQAVRDIAVISEDTFISGSNDATLKVWRVKIDGSKVDAELLNSLDAPSNNFIYTMSVLSGADNMWAVAGENSGIMVFNEGACQQVLQVPAISIWKVTELPNKDIAAACSDGKIWIFTKDVGRKAPADMVAVYEGELAKFKRPAQTELQGIKMEDLPAPSALLAPGKRDGQTKMVNDVGVVTVHSWSEAEQKWTKIGDVVGQPDQSSSNGFSAPGGGRVTFEGKEYDYVFDIDADNGLMLKLPYNLSVDPWHAAQDFIHKNELPQGYLDTIAQFIIKNSDQSKSTASSGGSADPFTGSGAYSSSSGSSNVRVAYGGDPFTGGGAYTTNGGGGGVAMEVDEANNNHFPPTDLVSFPQQPKFEAMMKKLKEFNEQVAEEDKLGDADLERLPNLCGQDQQSTVDDISNLMRALRWPASLSLPALDILRLAVLNPKANEVLFQASIIEDLFSLLLISVKSNKNDNCLMLAIRTIANMFSHEKGRAFLLRNRDGLITRLVTVLPNENKNVQVALATVMVNLSVASCCLGDDADPDREETQVQTLTSVVMLLLEAITEAEAKYRTLVALGTLLKAGFPDNLRLAKEIGAVEAVQRWMDNPDAVKKEKECGAFILQFLA